MISFYKIILKNTRHILPYLVLAIIIMFPLLRRGYILTLDMAWGPNIPAVDASNNSWLLHEILRLFAKVIGSEAVQKLLLIVTIVLAGYGAHRLSRLSQSVGKYPAAAYIAGMLYVCNPFFYTRFVNGQWMVMLGYAILPWAVYALWQLCAKPSTQTAALAALLASVTALCSIHVVGFVLLAALVIFVSFGTAGLKDRSHYAGIALGVWLLANCVWVVPLILGTSTISSQISGFNSQQSYAYATSHTVANSVPLSAAMLTGFWADTNGRYALPSDGGTIWFVWAAVLGILIMLGVVTVILRRERLGIVIILLGLIAWFLAMGETSAISRTVTITLTNGLPLYAGYREPQKWLMLLALAYGYLAAIGLARLLELKLRLSHDARLFIAALAALLPIAWMHVLLFGAGHQLHSVAYPADWYRTKQRLADVPLDTGIVAFPWHLYMRTEFAGRVTANLTPYIFDQRMIVSDDPEIKHVISKPQDDLHRALNLSAKHGDIDAQTLHILRANNVRYIMLLKERDWKNYGWLDSEAGIQKVDDNGHIRLYRLTAGD